MVKRKLTNQDILSLPKLYDSGLSSWAIAEKFDTCHSNILNHLKKLGINRRDRSSAAKEGVKAGRIIIKKNHIPENLKLNEDLSYILGVLCGDGYMDYSDFRRTHYIGLSATDKEFVDKFRITLFNYFNINPTNEFRKSKTRNWNNQFVVRLCSKEACEFINKIGNFGKYVWQVPDVIINSNNKIKCSFIRGFFDSEGNIDRKSRRVGATSVNLDGLRDIAILLKNIGIRTNIISEKIPKEHRRIKHNIRIQDRNSVELFNKNIGFTIERKQKLLDSSINSYQFRKILVEELNILKPEIIKLRNEGLNYTQISKKLDMSLTTVWNICKNVSPR